MSIEKLIDGMSEKEAKALLVALVYAIISAKRGIDYVIDNELRRDSKR